MLDKFNPFSKKIENNQNKQEEQKDFTYLYSKMNDLVAMWENTDNESMKFKITEQIQNILENEDNTNFKEEFLNSEEYKKFTDKNPDFEKSWFGIETDPKLQEKVSELKEQLVDLSEELEDLDDTHKNLITEWTLNRIAIAFTSVGATMSAVIMNESMLYNGPSALTGILAATTAGMFGSAVYTYRNKINSQEDLNYNQRDIKFEKSKTNGKLENIKETIEEIKNHNTKNNDRN